MELFVFAVAAVVCLGGAIGVVASRNPVHAALSLVATLFGIAVLFIAEEANFLAAVQVIVYAGAIVVLFLFVIMFLGVDKADDLRVEPLVGQRVAAGVLGVGVTALVIAALANTSFEATGVKSSVGELSDGRKPDINVLGEALFTRYVFAFEITSVLLVIAVVGAVLLARHPRRSGEIVDEGQAEREAELAERIAAAEAKVGGNGIPAHAHVSGEHMTAADDETASDDDAAYRPRFGGAGDAEGLAPADKAKA
jgi:NADH-quinone oxidoreductase subunit J